ncbi:IS607 family transposase [Plectonema radiosum NIES-515]|uniref:IS607 family transposase n=1 Tax=Plectonema radiosum NIES-515 TaxID=2986073 RepID=A0ABT3B2U5_9CYAN|nr:IS607 family transposase [Plectonema radiosum]MCV3215560.1 IS607 family transposase [Plectonema radiosum NIES-515]
MSKKYVSPKEAQNILGVTERTLRNWDEQGKIRTIRTPSGHRRYDIESITGKECRASIIYARVSSHKQKADLLIQADYLQSLYPESEVIKEVGSGLNYNRKKLKAILERVMSGDVKQVVVGHKDRLARFGFELLRWICELNDTELVVCNNTELSPEREMVEDILAIVHVFSCRLYGLRKYKTQIKEDKTLPGS